MPNLVLPAMAFLGKMTNTFSNNEFFEILQTDLQARILMINENNLNINYKKENLLRQSVFLQDASLYQLSLNNYELKMINSQLSELNYMISSKINDEQCEKTAREVVYNIKKIDEQLEKRTR
ncbi:MAG: hypothetical protein J5527_08115 [Treponema sp.]|nr:hypothetical protein [Treponema sp.]